MKKVAKAATAAPIAIRLSVTPEIRHALQRAKIIYPTLSDPEILKLGLSKIVTNDERAEIRRGAAYAVGYDYLRDPAEDIYTKKMGRKVDFA